jgi:hypothetical protein
MVTISLAACAPTIHQSQAFSGALASHKTVAILPADVTFQLRPIDAKNLAPEKILEMEQRTGVDVQRRMNAWFLLKEVKLNYTVEIQNVSKTNSLLKEANINYSKIKEKNKAELAKLLGVDAVIQSKLTLEQPTSEGAAVAVGVLSNIWLNTNKVHTTININDGKSGEVLWKYDHQASGSVGRSVNTLVDALMKNASKYFPYRKFKPGLL